MQNKTFKILIIAGVIVFFVLMFGINVFLEMDSGSSPVADQTYTQPAVTSEPAVSNAEISTEQIEAGAVEGPEGFETDEESEPEEADQEEGTPEEMIEADAPEPVEPVSTEPVASAEPVAVEPVVDNPVVENTTPPEEVIVPEVVEPVAVEPAPVVTPVYVFRNQKLLNEHYEKHGIEMGFTSAEAYQAAASAVITNPNSLFKIEAEDGDGVYYLEATNEFVVLSTDGYIRTYFLPSSGKAYFDRQ